MFRNQKGDATVAIVISLVVATFLLIGVMMWGMPQYRVYSQSLSGEADLRQAEQTRQILVEQARAERDASEMRAEAIAIVGQATQDFPEYRYQEYLGQLGEALVNCRMDQVVFIPTEANIPITEAGRTAK